MKPMAVRVRWGGLFVLLLLLAKAPAQEQPVIVATTSIFADMALNIVGDVAEVQTIVPIGSDPRQYEPTQSDVQLVARAELILSNGLHYEPWLGRLLERSKTEARGIVLTAGIIPLKYAQEQPNPHAWMDANLALIYIENIREALVAWMPEEQRMFDFNYGVYRRQIQDLDADIVEELQRVPPEKRILPTAHPALQYFGNRYGIQVAFQSTASVIDDQLYLESLGEPGSPASTYIEMLEHDAEIITAFLLRKEKRSTILEDLGRARLYLVLGVAAIALVAWVIALIWKNWSRRR